MEIGQFVKEGFQLHKASAFKIMLTVIALAIFLLALSEFSSEQKLHIEQAQQAAIAVENHTTTINEIQQAITELKASNAADHTTTIKYINCVLVGLTEAGANGTPGSALAIYQTCLANSQIPPGTVTN